jgi:hypothetical protein
MEDAKRRRQEFCLPPALIGLDEFQLAIPWRDALQQDPPPLHQPGAACSTLVSPVEFFSVNGKLSLNCLSHPRGQAQVVAKVEYHAGELFPRLGFIVTNLETPSRAVVRFYNKRGTAEQWIKEGKQAVKMTRLSCHRFRSNQVRLALSLLAYNLGNLWRRLGLPRGIENWSLTSLQQRLVKTGGRLVKHARYHWLLLAEGHLTRLRFGAMLGRITLLPEPTG